MKDPEGTGYEGHDKQAGAVEVGDPKRDGILPTLVHYGKDAPCLTLGNKEDDDRGNMVLETMGMKLVNSMGRSISLGPRVYSKR